MKKATDKVEFFIKNNKWVKWIAMGMGILFFPLTIAILLSRWIYFKTNLQKIYKYMFIGLFLFFGLFITSAMYADDVNNQKLSQSDDFKNQEIQQVTIKEPEVKSAADIQKSSEGIFLVKRVIDGDTIELDSGQKVRYIGIDTPETVHPEKSVECFGKEASSKNKSLVEGKKVRLEKDVSETDKYGRLVRYIYLEDGTFINLFLVKEGYAKSYTYPPDVKYQNEIVKAEQEARENQRGLWGSACNDVNNTSQPVNNNPIINNKQENPTSNSACIIKGNISYSTGEKIYHVPGGQYYDSTNIDESKGERWFCTELEAQADGWRKSKR